MSGEDERENKGDLKMELTEQERRKV